jgi:transposase
MAYREVTMIEITEVLRQWLAGGRRKAIARRVGLDPKTVRRYLRAAERSGLRPGMEALALTDERVTAILTALRGSSERPYGASWQQCEAHRDFIAERLRAGLRLSKVRRLLARQGVRIPTATLYRFATAVLGFGRRAPTIPVADGAPGEEVYLDTGWMTTLAPDETGRRRRFRAWIFTPGVSRYRFVYPCFGETTASAIEACEAAWRFYGGVFRVVIPDNTGAIITTADPLQPRVVPAFLEYAQARGFVVDPARVRRPTDKSQASHCTSSGICAASFGNRRRSLKRLPGCAAGNGPVSGAMRMSPLSLARTPRSTPSRANRLAVWGCTPSWRAASTVVSHPSSRKRSARLVMP